MYSVSRISLFIILVTSLLTGCPSTQNPPAGNSSEQEDSGVNEVISQRCRDNLKNAFSSLDPHRLEIDADIESTANVLNDWLSGCVTLPDVEEMRNEELEKILSDEQLSSLQGVRFSSRDVGHIRTCILLRDIAEQVSADANSDLDRTVRLFNYVCRNVIVQPDNQRLPLTLYEVVLFGRATTRHQAWLFAELLHQLRIDSAVLTPESSSSDKWVTAVCLEDGNYLFDFSLQTPVPASVETEWPIKTPASLKQVLEKPELVTRLIEAGSQIPTSEQLKNAAIRIPSNVEFWSPRMRELNLAQSGISYILADTLIDRENETGIISRLSQASEYWETDQITAWMFPEEQESGYWSIEKNSSESQALLGRKLPFHSPVEVEVNKEKQTVNVEKSGNKQWMARLTQLQGEYPKAITTYGGLRLGSQSTRNLLAAQGISPEFQIILQREDTAAEDAHFWVAVSQYELGELSDARSTLRDYLNRYQTARWTDAVLFLMAKLVLENGDTAAAISFLDQIPATSSLQKSALYLKSLIGKPSADSDSTEQTN